MPKLLLLPGMAADARLVQPQLDMFPGSFCPEWIKPRLFESLAKYAARFSESLRPLLEGETCVLAGASFGGFVASELSRHLPMHALVLIGSVLSPRELPFYMHGTPGMAAIFSSVPFPIRWSARQILHLEDGQLSPMSHAALTQAIDADPAFVRWAGGAVMGWRTNRQPIPCPIYHIHGTEDRVLPIKLTHPTHVVRGGGHILSLSHPDQVNAVIASAMEEKLDRKNIAASD